MDKKKVIDQWQRPLRDLRISVTDQCNFRCTYCMPKEIFGPDYPFLENEELLSFDEIVRIAAQFARSGVEKIRITGGEPLLRKGLPDLLRRLRSIEGIKDIALTTNGVLLPKLAAEIKEAGMDRVTVSLDTLDDHLFGRINGRGVGVQPILKGIEAAHQAGLHVKINMMVKKGINDQEILPMARYFKNTPYVLRFIEYMDVGTSNGWNWDDVVSKDQILKLIGDELPLEPFPGHYYGEVAKRYRYKDGTGEIGIISSISDTFCSTCTRARLSADGKVYTCLFASAGTDFKHFTRNGASDQQIYERIVNTWSNRKDRYSDERREKSAEERKKIEMSYIGG
ncbi:GTP 3',8-cyclase MoaA [Fictibacillus phosphorivorans]|uniref:GTP 3',8-cyclase MoaA n=1 Tax=Fictibacillus phosphorivorans TaxID=1221500 RepID=UPI00203D3A1C|nr:GTP 3',8-cyclase MoaA [Fictibacillus phosphorivorans]MCM3718305.1 GTP 3',8-cyclase MoaA [Fictibacillus phosphorivorans]MCM3775831.1 GTP 3',8-cyclase MoaA [Fictibacillus phosphorivorans]